MTKPSEAGLTPTQLWQRFLDTPQGRAHRESPCPHSWAFGPDVDGLLRLVLEGRKTATASPAPLYEVEGEVLPAVGDLSIILDSHGGARCLIQTTEVAILPFTQVPASQAYAEGEGDRSLTYWRREHEAVFRHWLCEAGLPWDEDLPVVCEHFQVLFRL